MLNAAAPNHPGAGWRVCSPRIGNRLELNEARRYVAIYGLNMNWVSGDVLRTLPAVTFLGAAAFLLIRWRQGFRSVGLREVLLLGATAIVALTFADNRKWPYFGVHTVPWLAVISAYALRNLWNGKAQIAVVGWLCLYVLAPVLAGAYVVQRRSNDRIYRPAVAALEAISGNGQMVFAPAEFLFAYQGPFIFDERLGFLSGKSVPAFAVSKEDLEQELSWSREGNPRLYAHVQSMLNRSCTMRYENQKYAVYACGSAGTSPH
jgi:hypothetical protein